MNLIDPDSNIGGILVVQFIYLVKSVLIGIRGSIGF